jgi:NADH-quinone oxidoreductase subunit G
VQALNTYLEQPGGKLLSGDPGTRLFEKVFRDTNDFYMDPPDAFLPREGELLVLPRHHVFGSEELSLYAPAIAQVSPKPYLALGPLDAQRLDVNEGEPVKIIGRSASYEFEASIHSGIPRGVAEIPYNLPETQDIDLPQWFRIKKDRAHE